MYLIDKSLTIVLNEHNNISTGRTAVLKGT